MMYEKVALTSELKPGEKKKVSLNGKEILLVNIEGMFYAVDNKCPHMGASLAEGNLRGTNIVCPKHGSAFNIKTGEFMESGKMFFINVKAKNLKVYPTKVEGDDILIEIE